MLILQFSKVNQTWFLIWNGQLLETFDSREIAIEELKYRGLEVNRSGFVTVKKGE